MKNKRIYIAIILLLVVVLVGLSTAYFRGTFNVEKTITGVNRNVSVRETFNAPEGWLPGATASVNYTFANNGETSMAVRAQIKETWTTKDNRVLPNTLETGEDVIEKTLGGHWVYKDGYYYYNIELPPRNTTTSIFTILTFNRNTPTDVVCTTDETGLDCSSTGKYTESKYKLDIDFELIEFSQAEEIWKVNVTTLS